MKFKEARSVGSQNRPFLFTSLFQKAKRVPKVDSLMNGKAEKAEPEWTTIWLRIKVEEQ
jgi:hypothetical protein